MGTTAAASSRIDRRVRKSRRAILDAFDRLITTTSLDAITVSQIAREADVDRKTFYQHFGTIDGLLDVVADKKVSELLDDVERLMREQATSGEETNLTRAFFGALAERLGKDQALAQGYCEHVPSELILDRLARSLDRQALERGIAGNVSDGKLDALLVFGLGGIISVYRWWLASDRALSLPELMDFAESLVGAGVTSYLQ